MDEKSDKSITLGNPQKKSNFELFYVYYSNLIIIPTYNVTKSIYLAYNFICFTM